MTSKFLTRGLLIAGVALVSCNEIDPDRNTAGDNVIITATIECEGVTRSCIDPEEYVGKTGILWTDGDCLGVFTESGSENAEFSKKTAGAVAKATFGGSITGTPKYAYYPYTADNQGKSVKDLTGRVSAEQSYSQRTGLLSDDWKYGTLRTGTSASADGYEFAMTHMFALAKVVIDATGTPIEGETLESIAIKATAGTGSDVRRINGAFTFSAVDGSYTLAENAVDETDNTTTMEWTDQPALESGKSYTGYITLIPDVKVGDKITVTIMTSGHTAVFEVPCIQDLKSGHIYNLPMTLTSLAEKMKAEYGTEPTYKEIGGTTPDPEPVVTTGTFTACAFNVDGLPTIVNNGGPGSGGTTTMARTANGLGWDIIAASEDFEYNSQLVSELSNYSHGTYRGSVGLAQIGGSVADTDGLNFFWRTSTTSATSETYVEYNDKEGDIWNGANTCIKKGFRYYEVTVAEGVVIDVYITHMNTYDGSGNTEDNAYVKAVLSQLRQIRDYVLKNAAANKRPAIIMGDTNMRYTRHDIKTNFLDYVASYTDANGVSGYTVSDPWVEFHRGGVYPAWNSLSLMTRFAFAGDTSNDIVCADNQCGEVVDKIWYINVPGAEVQLKATAHENDVEHFYKSITKNQKYTGVMVEDANGTEPSGNTRYNKNQTVVYDKYVGYSDHFPVVTTFKWTKTVKAE